MRWALNNTSVFKIVLLNLQELSRLQVLSLVVRSIYAYRVLLAITGGQGGPHLAFDQVEYLPNLQMFEDVCINVQACWIAVAQALCRNGYGGLWCDLWVLCNS